MSIKVRVQDNYNLSVKSSSGSVRRIETGNGLIGGPITSTGTISINPGPGLIANSSGLFIDISNIDANTVGGNTAQDLNDYASSVASNAYVNSILYTNNAVNTAIAYSNTVANNAYTNAISFTIATISGANAAVGAGANAYAAVVGAAGNNYTTSVGLAGNAYALATATTIGTAGNNFTIALQNGSNTAVGAGANAYSISLLSIANLQINVATAASNAYANAVGVAANSFMIAVQNGSNTAVGAGANAYALATATTIGTAGNNFTIALQNGSNTAVGAGANAYALLLATAGNAYTTLVGASANSYANDTFVKLTSPNQTITGTLTVAGNLIVTGNSTVISANNLAINDPFILLANNNMGDSLDIGITAHYDNASAFEVHTGIFRSHISKEWYLFKEYNKHFFYNGGQIDVNANNFTLDTLNAVIKTSDLTLGGQNAILWISSAFTKANDVAVAANAYALATATTIGTAGNNFTIALQNGSNTAVGAGANAYAVTVGTASNNYTTSVGLAGNAYALATATTIGTAGNNFTIALQNGANTAVGAGANAFASNANNITTGILSIDRLPNTNVTANVYGSSTKIPVLNISSKGIIIDVTLANVSSIGSNGSSISDFTYNSNNNTLTITSTDETSISTTINSVNVFSVTGNLTTTGQQTYIRSNTVLFDDNLLILNKNLNTSIPDIGIAGYYQSANSFDWGSESITWGTDTFAWGLANLYTGIIRDASDGRWKVFDNYDTDPDANTELGTLNIADFQAKILYANSISANGSLGNSGQVLHSDGTNIYWATDDVNVPAGNDTEIQFNNSGSFGANSGLTYNVGFGRLNIGNVGITSETVFFGANGLSFSNGSSNAIFVNANGNIGIDTTSPSQRLSVNGNISLTGSIVANGSIGESGQVLTSNGSVSYWNTPISTFSNLTDTPSSFETYGLNIVRVNSTETGLEYTDSIDIEEFYLDDLVHAAKIAPSDGSIEADSVAVYVTASGISPNREVAYKVKNELNEEIIISSILI